MQVSKSDYELIRKYSFQLLNIKHPEKASIPLQNMLNEFREHQPQPDEELVKESSDKIIDICLTHTCVGSIKGEKFTSLPQGAVMDIQQVIRTLLQSRPVVTREEIEECFNHQCYIVENIIRLLKSKGIPVNGEK